MDIYVLEDRYGAMYIGITSNLTRRLKEHITGKCSTTRKMHKSSIALRHFWKVPSFSLASRLERYLHSISKSEVLDLVLDCKYWCKDLEELALTKQLQQYETDMDKAIKTNQLHAIVSLPNKDQLSRIK